MYGFLKQLFGISAIVVVGITAYFSFLRPTPPPPAEFFASREAAAETSQKIVTLASLVSAKIEKVNVRDIDVNRTLQLIEDARISNDEAYAEAYVLSQHLKKITETLNAIRSKESRQLAYEAVSIELGLISELMSYAERLNKFLEGLADSVVSPTQKNLKLTDGYLKNVNEKVAMINKLNKDFLKKMRAFDESF